MAMYNRLLAKFFGDNISMRQQILSVIIIGVIFLCLLGSLLIAWISTQKIREVTLSHAIEKLHAFGEKAQTGFIRQDEIQLNRLLEQTVSQKSVMGAAIVDAQGKTIAALNLSSEQVLRSQNLLSRGPGMAQYEDNHAFMLVKPVVLNVRQQNSIEAQTQGSVVIQVNKDTLKNARLDTFLTIFSVGLAMSLFMVGLVNITITRFTRPIYRLADLMKESKHTGMHLLSQEEGPKEIKDMAQAYNAMIKSLDEQEEKLRKHSEQLEQQVEIRTEELVNARDAALTASRHKSAFLANVTHELRTPIQAIIGYIDLVKEELELDGQYEYSADLNKVQLSSERLLNLINGILDLSKVEAGKMDAKVSVVEVKPIIKHAVDSITPLLDMHQNLLVGPQNDTELFIETDKSMVQQIVINLLSNACKFTRQGTISIDYYSDKTDFYVTLQDTGCGISAEQINDIFDEFRQVNRVKRVQEPVSAKKFDGTGLGLAISQKFAHLLGGEITVKSQVGEGSQFTLRLPL